VAAYLEPDSYKCGNFLGFLRAVVRSLLGDERRAAERRRYARDEQESTEAGSAQIQHNDQEKKIA
jgi:hypothetical protein